MTVAKKYLWDCSLLFGALFVVLFLDKVDIAITLHMLVYIMITWVCLRSIFQPSVTTARKAFAVLLYDGILLIQLSVLMLTDFSQESRIFSAAVLVVTFLIDHLLTKQWSTFAMPRTFTENMISYEDLRYYKSKLNDKVGKLKKVGGVLTPESIKDMMCELPRNCSIRYVNKESLSEEYFKHLDESMGDPYVYFVLSDTGSTASNFIGILTSKPYNHISISFDPALKTLISYNGGERLAPPGLNPELLEWFYKKEDASIKVYRLEVTLEQKRGMAEKIRQINVEGSAYNVVGVSIRKSLQPNIMVCSEFVYNLLESVGAGYFKKPAIDTKPTDMIELDYYRKLEYVETIQLSACCEEMMGKGKPVPMESKVQVADILAPKGSKYETQSMNS